MPFQRLGRPRCEAGHRDAFRHGYRSARLSYEQLAVEYDGGEPARARPRRT